MKKLTVLLVSLCLLCSITYGDNKSFIDVSEDDWFAYDVIQLLNQGYVSGFPEGTFRPNVNISVEEFITITIKVVGEDEVIMDKTRWSDGFIQQSLDLEYVLEGEFDSYQRDITRGEMSRIILRASQLDVPDNYQDYSSMIVDFNDMDTYWQDISLRVYTTGIIGGFPDGTFALNKEATRAQASVVLNKLLEPDRRSIPTLIIKSSFDDRVSYLRYKWSSLKPTYNGERFIEKPSIVAPYSVGTLVDLFIQDAVKTLKFVRILAGVSEDIYDSDSANTAAQHGALLNAVAGFSHTPDQPSDMDDELYNIAYDATSSSNLAMGSRNLSEAIKYLMEDADASNIDRVGHRRWFLLPKLNEVGFGHVNGTESWRYFSVMKVFRNLNTIEREYDYVLWPNKTAFPTEFISSGAPWSVTLNPTLYDRSKTSDISVVLTRVNDNKVWHINWNDTNKSGEYFNVETNYYAIPFCIIFRPLMGGETYKSGDMYNIKIGGLYTVAGQETTFEYELEFFNLD
jgi:hypothetical protein